MDELSALISTVGFPIAAFVLMFWFCKDTLKSMQDNFTRSLSDMQNTVNSNTTAITKLLTYMEAKDRSDIDGK